MRLIFHRRNPLEFTNPIVGVENLSYTVTNGAVKKQLINNLQFQSNPGEVLGIIGPNGAGKSTLMKLLLGFLTPSQGLVYLGDHPIQQLSHKQRASLVSYMGQSSVQSFPFSVRDILAMGWYAKAKPGSDKELKERVDQILEQLEMTSFADRSFLTLSGGEKQLVLFGRVLLQDTPIILLDEPTASLDIGHEHTLLQWVRTLAQLGKTILMAIHNLNSASEYCNRLLLLNHGNLVALGKPKEVLVPEHLETHYKTPVSIGTNETTGSVTVNPRPPLDPKVLGTVHIIGGAGSGIELTRRLYQMGIPVTGGIAHELDSDARLWKSLGVPFVEVPAFSEINHFAFEEAEYLIRKAKVTVLCSFPFGKGNKRNLELANQAQHLIILDDSSGTCAREFFDSSAQLDYQALVKLHQPVSITTALEQITGLVVETT
jgi:iron complex transport system ATP-binding protein